MHYFQQRYLRENRTFAALAGLETIDLPNKGLLSGLEIRVWGLCAAGFDTPDVWLHDRIKKVELVVNGSQVVKSYDARQLLALMLYKRTPHYSHDMKNMASQSCEEYFYINLGRHYHDMEYMLDLSKVSDPELRIEHDFTMTGAEGWTNGVAMAVKPQYSIIPHLLRDPDVIPKGYIKTSEIYRFPQLANRQENMIVPRGPTYSNLYLQSFYAAQGLTYLLDKVELNFNNDAIIPLRVGILELSAELARKYGLFRWSEQASYKGGQAYPMALESGHFQPQLIGLLAYEPGYIDLWGQANSLAYKDIATGLEPYTGDVNTAFTILGALPFSVAAIPYFDPWDERTWINSSALGDFWVRVELGAGGAAPGVVKLLGDEVVTRYVTPSWP